MIKCHGITPSGNGCVRYGINNSNYCLSHQYFTEYTAEMLESLQQCKLCKTMRFIKENEDKCDVCINSIVKCAYEDCKFKRSTENKYCKKHQIGLFLDEVKEEGKKVCYQYIRGCRSKLDIDYKFSKCEKCLENERKKDHAKRNAVKIAVVSNPNNRICATCCIEQSKDEFVGEKESKTETKTCLKCRTSQKIQDEHRDREHRNELARVASKNPERIAVKDKWRENNYEKVTETWMKSRDKRAETMGVDEFLKKNAEDAKKWRDNNPDKCKKYNEKKKNSTDLQYMVYCRSAEYKNLKFELSKDEYKSIVQNPCHYCGLFKEEKDFSGIDRRDQTLGYIVSNCVPCCEMCNFMKKSLSEDVFIKRIEHILLYNGLINCGEYYYELFTNHNSISYNRYKTSATVKQFDFQITEKQFHNLTCGNCYICGKIPTNIHKNGIDRFNSSIGYVFENCRCCCGECNYMKNKYEYRLFMDKLKVIYKYYYGKPSVEENITQNIDSDENKHSDETNHFDNPDKLDETNQLDNPDKLDETSNSNGNENTIITKIVKKSKEQIKEEAKIRKQKQIARLKETIGNEEYRKKRAHENALKRQTMIDEIGEEEYKKIKNEKMAKYRQIKKDKLNNQTEKIGET